MTWQRIDENTYIDDTLVTCAEYQLFIDEMREQGKYYQPDHWTLDQFSEGQALSPILGVRYSDAVAFCEWLTLQGGSKQIFTLLTKEETESYKLMDTEASYWTFPPTERTLSLQKHHIENVLNADIEILDERKKGLLLAQKQQKVFYPSEAMKIYDHAMQDISFVQPLEKDVQYLQYLGLDLKHLLPIFTNLPLSEQALNTFADQLSGIGRVNGLHIIEIHELRSRLTNLSSSLEVQNNPELQVVLDDLAKALSCFHERRWANPEYHHSIDGGKYVYETFRWYMRMLILSLLSLARKTKQSHEVGLIKQISSEAVTLLFNVIFLEHTIQGNFRPLEGLRIKMKKNTSSSSYY